MRSHKKHIEYAVTHPFMADSNNLDVLFDRLDEFDPIERMRMLDLTCCVFDLGVPIDYRDDEQLSQEIYGEFRRRCSRLTQAIPSFLITYVAVLITLTTLRERSNPSINAARLRKMKDVLKLAQQRVLGKEISSVASASLIQFLKECVHRRKAEITISQERYVVFCDNVVSYLL